MAQVTSDQPHKVKPAQTAQENSTQYRLLPIFGSNGLIKLRDATVMVIGLGGVGSSCVEALARGGIGHLILVDRDTIEPSNINRQALAFHSTVGKVKTEVMRAMVQDINPACMVETHHMFVSRTNLPELFEPYLGKLDYVIDAIDTITQKLELALLAQHAEEEGQGFPLVSAAGAAYKLRPELFRFSDISKTHTDPLCKDLRKMCRKHGVKKLEMLFSTEVPLNRLHKALAQKDSARTSTAMQLSTAVPPQTSAKSRLEAPIETTPQAPLGTASYMPPIMGQMLAGHVICRIADITGGPDAGIGGAGANGASTHASRAGAHKSHAAAKRK